MVEDIIIYFILYDFIFHCSLSHLFSLFDKKKKKRITAGNFKTSPLENFSN